MKYNYFTIIFALITCFSFAQNTQTIKGVVLDFETQQPIFGASVFVETPNLIGTTSDFDGNFKLENIPTGKITLKCTYLGYETYISSPISLTTGKELDLSIKMVEQVLKTNEVVILGTQKGRAKNESMVLSSKSFDIKETQRFAASLNDPGRVALNFPGVQAGQDNDNDVMVRGNSAMGILWRVEGIDVPNVNHFSRPGSSGGGITALSPNVLARSDFSTGAFPSEYGNAFSGVFDVKFRKGNHERYEFSANVGVIGLNFAAEGPFSKKGKSSFLFNYRYSTLSVLDAVGIHVVSEDTRNIYQDMSFNVNIASKKKARVNIFGLGGISSEITNAKTDTAVWEKWTDKRQVDFLTNLGVLGVSWTQLLNEKSYVKTVVAYSYNDVTATEDTLGFNTKNRFRTTALYDTQHKIGVHSFYNKKISAKLSTKAGVHFDQYFFKTIDGKYNHKTDTYRNHIDVASNTQLIRPYAQIKYRVSQKGTFIGGLHAVLLSLNNSYSIEPRVSYTQKIGKMHQVSLAYGLHGKALPFGNYHYTEVDVFGNDYKPNWDLKMIKSHHVIASYDINFLKNYHIKVEPFFQYMFDVPVGVGENSTFSLLNGREGFTNQKLVSDGTGMNYGVDVSFEKYYTKNWFMMFNAGVFQSTYTPKDGKTYNTFYDNRFGLSAMAGYEHPFKKNSSSLELGTRIQYSGGFRGTPIDKIASAEAREAVYDESQPYSLVLPNYFRPDLRIAYKQNKKKFTWKVSLDLANFVDYKNVLRESYNVGTNEIEYRYQTGLTPILAFQFDFYKTIKRD